VSQHYVENAVCEIGPATAQPKTGVDDVKVIRWMKWECVLPVVLGMACGWLVHSDVVYACDCPIWYWDVEREEVITSPPTDDHQAFWPQRGKLIGEPFAFNLQTAGPETAMVIEPNFDSRRRR